MLPSKRLGVSTQQNVSSLDTKSHRTSIAVDTVIEWEIASDIRDAENVAKSTKHENQNITVHCSLF
jgi:hypothetical protein